MECVATEILSYYSGKQGYKDGQATDHHYGFLLQTGYYLKTGAITQVETSDGPVSISTRRKLRRPPPNCGESSSPSSRSGRKTSFGLLATA